MPGKIKVLIVDDSAVVRKVLADILQSDDMIEVIGEAADPFIAAGKMKHRKPDVIMLDIEMPRMDGLTFLQKIMTQHPIPVVICSSLAEEGCETSLKALEYGAVEIITKQKMGIKNFLEESRIQICDAVKAASQARITAINKQAGKLNPAKKLSADVMIPVRPHNSMIRTTDKIAVIGASTGGTEALRRFLSMLPQDSPGIVIVQHMPENFTRSFALHLNETCRIEVKEAENGDKVLRGRALIAPGNRHTLVRRSGARYYVEVKEGPLVCRHRPSVDVLFRSAAQYGGANVIGIIMTGMGDDGAEGMRELKDAGAYTIAQNRESCVVFGMPNKAISRGAVDQTVHIDDIASVMLDASIHEQVRIQEDN